MPMRDSGRRSAGRRPVPAAAAARSSRRARSRPKDGRLRARLPNLLDRLTGVVAVCRPARRPVSLLLVTAFGRRGTRRPPAGRRKLPRYAKYWGRSVPSSTIPEPSACRIRNSAYALILPGAERQQAIELGNDLIRTVRTLAMSAGVRRKNGGNSTWAWPRSRSRRRIFPPRSAGRRRPMPVRLARLRRRCGEEHRNLLTKEVPP